MPFVSAKKRDIGPIYKSTDIEIAGEPLYFLPKAITDGYNIAANSPFPTEEEAHYQKWLDRYLLDDTLPDPHGNVRKEWEQLLLGHSPTDMVSRANPQLTRKYYFPYAERYEEMAPFVGANMFGASSFRMAERLKEIADNDTRTLPISLSIPKKMYTEDEWVNAYESIGNQSLWYTLGVQRGELEALENLDKRLRQNPDPHAQIDKIVMDIAHGGIKQAPAQVRALRERFPRAIIMAGNAGSAEVAIELAMAGADIIKVGIGPGTECTTRRMTGVGVPQASAVYEVTKALRPLGILTCADGGASGSIGNYVKALALADFSFVSGIIKGYSEGYLDFYEALDNPEKFNLETKAQEETFRILRDALFERDEQGRFIKVPAMGSSSVPAAIFFNHGNPKPGMGFGEGRWSQIDERGDFPPVVIENLYVDLASAMTYRDAHTLEEFQRKARFLPVQYTHPRPLPQQDDTIALINAVNRVHQPA